MSADNPRLIKSVRFHQHGASRFIAVEPDTASWAVLDGEAKEFLESLDGSRGWRSVVAGDSRRASLLDRAFAVGLILSGEERRLPADLFASVPAHMQPWHAVLNVTHDCNLGCRYCYARGGQRDGNMSPELMAKIFAALALLRRRRSRGDDPGIALVLHGGEPLLALEEIREGIARIRRHPQQSCLRLMLQTNGTLIDDEAVRLIREERINVGVSIDGTPAVHDKTRPFRDGSPSYAKVREGIERLKAEAVPFGLLIVITRVNAEQVGRMFEEFVAMGVRSLSFCRFFPGGRGVGASELAIDNDLWYAVLRTLLDLTLEFNRKQRARVDYVQIRELSQLMHNLLSKSRKYMCRQSPCGAGRIHLGFMPDGSVYPCDRFAGEESMVLGNIQHTALEEILDHHPLLSRLLSRRVDRTQKCCECDWRWVCGGGCPARAYLERGTFQRRGTECSATLRLIKDLIMMAEDGVVKPEYLVSRRDCLGPIT